MRSKLLQATTSLTIIALLGCLLTHSQAQQPKTKGAVKTQYGNVTIEKFDRVKGNLDLDGLLITGKETLITVPYPRSQAMVKLHADKITTQRVKSDYFAKTDLEGHTRFTISQKLPDGNTRILEGTSNSANFRRDNDQVRLVGNVVATIRDDANLVEPAHLTADQIAVDIHSIPYRYTLTGSQKVNEIRLVVRPKTPVNPPPHGKPEPPKHITIRGYRTATFKSADESLFEGKGTTLEFAEQDNALVATIKAPYIKTEMKGMKGSLSAAELKGGIAFTLRMTRPETKSQQVLEGSAERATYSFTEHNLVLQQQIQATLDAPESLVEPAKIHLEKLSIRTTTPTRYQMEANPQTALLEFIPKKRDSPKPKAPAQNSTTDAPSVTFRIGTIRVTNFKSGTFEENKEASFTGDRLLFETLDPPSGSIARFRTRTILAEFGENNILTQAVAAGNVDYFLQQIPLSKKSLENVKPLPQTLSGTARKVTMRHHDKQDSVDIAGPFRTELNLPERLLEPGLITGAQGDNINLTMEESGFSFDITTPNQTAFVRLLPREIVEPEEKPKKAPTPQKENGKS